MLNLIGKCLIFLVLTEPFVQMLLKGIVGHTKSTKFFVKEQTKQTRKAYVKCPQEKFSQCCQSGHIPKEHLRNGWKTPENIVWTPFLVKPKIRVWFVDY